MNENRRIEYKAENKFSRWGFVVLLIALFFSMQSVSVVRAAVIIVNDVNDNLAADDGLCTLREAISNANLGGDSTDGDCAPGTAAGVDTIILPAGTYILNLTGADEDANATGDLDITDDIIISGAGVGVTIIDGNATDRVIHTHGSVNMDINDLDIRNGAIGTIPFNSGNGGGIYHFSSGIMNLTRINVLDNLAGHRGGGIENAGTAILENCTLDGNQSRYGGGMVNRESTAITTITNSTFANNMANNFGGGLNVYDGTVTVTNSTFVDNHGPGDGGGLANRGQLTVANSTISGNETTGNGGGIFTYGGTTAVSNSTITSNLDGDGIYNDGGTITLANSIVSSNSGFNCVNTITDGGNNLEYPGTDCGGFSLQADPLLGSLSDNGGPTQTHAFAVGSPAIDAGNNATCETNDQRGATRPTDGNADSTAICDIGAFELGELQCGIVDDVEPTTYQFLGNTVSLNVTDDNISGGGAELDCLRVTDIPWDHPEATSGGSGAGIKTGKYWIINGLQNNQSTIAGNYSLDLTLPHSVTPDEAKICKYPGSQGGAGWDCDRTDANESTVWLNEITSLSDWAVGENVGPTAVSLQSISISANRQSFGWVLVLFCGLLLATAGLWLRRSWR